MKAKSVCGYSSSYKPKMMHPCGASKPKNYSTLRRTVDALVGSTDEGRIRLR
jgi:hypothetical protein